LKDIKRGISGSAENTEKDREKEKEINGE